MKAVIIEKSLYDLWEPGFSLLKCLILMDEVHDGQAVLVIDAVQHANCPFCTDLLKKYLSEELEHKTP